VGIDVTRVIPRVLSEMRETYGVNERLARQCIEANRHNSLSAFYYLLLIKKKLEGEVFTEEDFIEKPQRKGRDSSGVVIMPEMAFSPPINTKEAYEKSKVEQQRRDSFEYLDLEAVPESSR
jgi:hypothetical protein